MHTPESLKFEKAIVWVKGGPEDYTFLRESVRLCHFREKFPLSGSRVNVVAYATLSPASEKAWGKGGRIEARKRRFWWIRDTDTQAYGLTNCPMEAVEPSSIAPGRPSRLRWDVIHGTDSQGAVPSNEVNW